MLGKYKMKNMYRWLFAYLFNNFQMFIMKRGEHKREWKALVANSTELVVCVTLNIKTVNATFISP